MLGVQLISNVMTKGRKAAYTTCSHCPPGKMDLNPPHARLFAEVGDVVCTRLTPLGPWPTSSPSLLRGAEASLLRFSHLLQP